MILFAALGGAVHYLYTIKNFSFVRFVIGIVAASFTGFVVYLSLDHFGIADGLRAAIVGMSGYTSNDLLKLLENKLLNKINRMID